MAEVQVFNANLTKDPELKTIAGKEMLVFSVAENTKVNGEKVTTYWDVVSPNVKSVGLLGKGCKVSVRGNLKVEIYEGKTRFKCWCNQFSDLQIHSYKKDDAEAANDNADLPF